MQENHWKAIWDRKASDTVDILKQSDFELFCYLKRQNGFDVNVKNEEKYYVSFYKAWEDLNLKLTKICKKEIESVYEIGCGSGVNLFLFSKKYKVMRVGGIDYSERLIKLAGKVVNSEDLICGEADSITTEPKYDAVISESVFQYFSSLKYAEAVLRKMICKSNLVTYLGDMHDEEKKDEWLENRRRSMKNYDEIYKGLDKMFYRRDWIEKIACDYGKKVMFTKTENDEYWNSKYTYNCFIY